MPLMNSSASGRYAHAKIDSYYSFVSGLRELYLRPNEGSFQGSFSAYST